jgi:hypothetical protein
MILLIPQFLDQLFLPKQDFMLFGLNFVQDIIMLSHEPAEFIERWAP